jgi:glucan phosphorylase
MKGENKKRLARIIRDTSRVDVNPDSMFDIQAKRIQEYKRLLINVMHIMHDCLRLVEDEKDPLVARTYVFAGEAAPGYWAAKQGLFHWIFNVILDGGDEYFHLADLESYIQTHERAAEDYKDTGLWAKKAILDAARMGKFSSDRS